MAAGERFVDRRDAGRQLAQRVAVLTLKEPIVYALPRGGVPVAAEIAAALQAPLDLILVRKLGAPLQPELAVGAIVDGAEPELVINDEIARETGADQHFIAEACKRELAEIERRRARYLGNRPRTNPLGRTVVVVDDGIATGATTIAALRALKKRGAARRIVAVPVAPPDTVQRLRQEADEVICLMQPAHFWGISGFYLDFHQLDDTEVTRALDSATQRLNSPVKQ
jgi:predicted phosphoribosyltransferase